MLGAALGERAFAYANQARTALTRGFSVYHYEAITLGVQSRIGILNPNDQAQMQTLTNVLMQVKLDPDFIKMTTGGGKNSPGQLNDRISFVQTRMEAQA